MRVRGVARHGKRRRDKERGQTTGRRDVRKNVALFTESVAGKGRVRENPRPRPDPNPSAEARGTSGIRQPAGWRYEARGLILEDGRP